MSPFLICPKTLEAIKRKQLEKYHKAPEDEKEKIECNPYVIFHQALKNCQPIIGLSNITKGGKTYQVKGGGLGPHLVGGELAREINAVVATPSAWTSLSQKESQFVIWIKTAFRNPVQDQDPSL